MNNARENLIKNVRNIIAMAAAEGMKGGTMTFKELQLVDAITKMVNDCETYLVEEEKKLDEINSKLDKLLMKSE